MTDERTPRTALGARERTRTTRPAAPSSKRTSKRAPKGRILGLDGLRAVAILAVLIFHLRPATLPGGYLGVDIFFVVSGFLITTLLVRELQAHGKLDLAGFWTRRARRLLPALVVVVIVSTVLGLIAGNDLLVDIRRQILGAATFSSNWIEIAAGSSYFAATAPQLFVNFWSLAVEEQFYLLWPVLLAVLLAVTRTGRQRVGVALSCAGVSIALMALLSGQDSTRVYYGTDTHAFGLMIGAALALSLTSPDVDLRRFGWWQRARVPAAFVAAAGLLALLFLLDGEASFAYRGGIALASVLTAVLVAALATARGDRDLLVRLALVRPLVWLGERSYGIYLWHWPVWLILGALLPRAVTDSALSWFSRGLTLILTLVLAAVSYRFIEAPIRRDGFKATFAGIGRGLRGARRTGTRIGAVVGAALVIVFIVAMVVAPTQSRVELQMAAAASAVAGPSVPESSVPADTSHSAISLTLDANGLPTGDQMSTFGDSMLYVAAPALRVDYPGIAIDAKSNRQWPDVVTAISTALEAGTVRDIVVIAAGTNAGLRDPAPLEEALDLLGSERVIVLVNIYHSSGWISGSNQTMAQIAADHPNVVVADWYGTITTQLDQLQPDGVHPDMEGMYLFSDVVTDALAQAPGIVAAREATP